MPQLKFLLAGGLIIGVVFYLMLTGIDGSMVYYYGISELKAKAPELYDKGIRVSGYVQEGSIIRYPGESRVDFVVFEKTSDQTVPVTYIGVIPDTFKDHAEVVVEGKFASSDNHFHATTLLAKCPSKYERMDEPADSESTPTEAGASL